MSTDGAAAREDITFEQGYEELKGIVARLGEEDISVHEMFEGFRRGKGLEQALRGYLTEREGELTEIEQGNNLPEFNIIAPSCEERSDDADGNGAQQQILAARTTDSPSSVGESEIPF